jgi:hypothetical protein
VPVALTLGPGTHGIALETSSSLGYTNGTSTVEDAALRFDGGRGLASPVFAGGDTFDDRIWNGTVHYDIRAPSVESGPAGGTPDSTPTFSFSAGGDPDTPQCRVYPQGDPAPVFSACSGPGSTHTPAPALTDGSYSFEVRTLNADSNASHIARREFTVHTGPLATTTIGSGPSGATRSRSPVFGFSANAPATFECRVFGRNATPPAFAPCSGPGDTHVPALPLADGAYALQVRGINQADTPGPLASRNFTVDTIAPAVAFGEGPGDGSTVRSNAVTFTFSSSEAGTRLQCSADGGSFTACSSPRALTGLSLGRHTFSVRATDPAGNTSAPATRSFSVEAVSKCGAAEARWTSAQGALTKARKALTKAQRALRKAKASRSRAKIRRSKAALKKRKRAVSRASRALRRAESTLRADCP